MTRDTPLFTISNLQISATWSFYISFVILSLLLAGISLAAFRLPIAEALLGGLLAALFYYIGEFIHQYGHSLAARRTGYPMTGMRFWFVLATSLYPVDEGDLPGGIHIRRALGGPLLSACVTLLSGVLLFIMRDAVGLWVWLVWWIFWEHLLVFSLGAFIPIRIGSFASDGRTILDWWGRRS